METPTEYLRRVQARALEVFEHPAAAKRWIDSTSIPLGGVRPVDLLGTDIGFEQVMRELVAIEYGLPV